MCYSAFSQRIECQIPLNQHTPCMVRTRAQIYESVVLHSALHFISYVRFLFVVFSSNNSGIFRENLNNFCVSVADLEKGTHTQPEQKLFALQCAAYVVQWAHSFSFLGTFGIVVCRFVGLVICLVRW